MKQFFLLFLFIPIAGIGQINNSSWGVADTIITIDKTTDFGPVHDYIEIFNNSGQDLQMRWMCLEPISWPTLWVTNFSDTENNYTDVQHIDSADFMLMDPPLWNNKLIIGVEHMSFAQTDTVSFKVWPLNFPEDSLTIHYVIIIAQGNSWASINESSIDFKYLFNEQNKTIRFAGSDAIVGVNIYSLTGRLVYSEEHYSLVNSEPIDLSNYSNEMLIINLITEDNLKNSFKILVH
ncbi:MAG: hypothetical protein QNK23_10090 [Crocinitomicaceae bacterium]|nr:hypothetical protein [Crocinitomicaceae bacterium]